MRVVAQNGSAITEFIVSLLVLVPIFTLFTLVGKMSDVENAAQEGARYQAWEIALTGSGATNTQALKAEMHERILQTNEHILTDTSSVDVEDNPDRPLWGMYAPGNGGQREALVNFDDAGYANETSHHNPGLRAYALQWDIPIPTLDTVGIDGIDRDGLYNAKVNFSINEVTALGFSVDNSCSNGTHDGYLVCMERNNAILVDDWSAAEPSVVVSRVQELNPALFLWKPFTEVLETVEELPLLIPTPGFDFYEPFKDLQHIDRAAGFVLPDVIPQDKLGSYEAEGISEAID